MTTIAIILTEGFADWETGLLSAVARSFYGVTTIHASPNGKTIVSAGGLRVTPDAALEEIDIEALGALIVCGSTAWQQAGWPDLTSLLRTARERGKAIGAICDGTVAAARTGVLDDVRHTSNGPGYLDSTGYRGKLHYQDVPHAVSDQNVVTASATAPVSFMGEIMRAIGLGDEQIDYFLGLHAAQHKAAA